MARIEAFGMGHIVHVVVQFTAVPVKSSYFIYAVFQSEVGRFRRGLVHIGVYRHRVAWQMQCEIGSGEVYFVDVYFQSALLSVVSGGTVSLSAMSIWACSIFAVFTLTFSLLMSMP